MTDTLTIYLSGDAWQGNPEAEVNVNGVNVGGVLDVAAINAQDDVQAFTFTGNFGTRPVVAVSYLNDPYTGTPAQQQNLYLDGFSYDNVSQLGDKKAYYYDQTNTFTLSASATPAIRAAAFKSSLGVDVHLDYWNTSYGLIGGTGGNEALVARSLAYLGITNLRVGVPTAQTLPEMEALAASGAKFDVLMPSTSSSSLLTSQLAAIAPIASAVMAVEGPNEVNLTSDFSWNGSSTLGAAAAYQSALYAAVEATPDLAKDAVYSLTLGGVGASGYAGLGNLSAAATDGNMHVYYQNGLPPASTLQYALGLATTSTPSDPTVITETNYTSAPMISGSVSVDVQARYDLDLLMDATKDGVQATFLYELLDEQVDPKDTNNEDHFGLFNADGTPKEVATAIHNLMATLSDTGSAASTFTPGALAYTISGLPASGDTLLMEKSNGAFDLVVWAEPEIWNAKTSTPIAATPRATIVQFAGIQSEVKVVDPLTGNTVSDSFKVSSVVLSVTDHPLIVEVEPAAVSLPAGLSTVGAGPNVVALNLSEDAFQGDAQFTVSVDGTQVGGTMTVTASHAAGQTQLLNIDGTFGAGKHTVAVDFLNDLYTPGVGDRNLYVTSSSYNGAAITGGSLTLDSAGTQTMSFINPAQALPTVGAG
ncbi:carbohydrate-binding domain-containing protein, partial [Lichenicoccus roseus]